MAWTAEVCAEMSKERPDVPRLRRWMLGNYAAQSGIQIQPEDPLDATSAQFIGLAKWLAFQELNDGVGILMRRWPRLQHILHADYSTKISAVSQRHCSICHGGRPMGDLLPISRYVVRITPISRQASRSKPGAFGAFQAAFAERFSKRPVNIGKTGQICMALTFVLNERKQDKDVDNMSKAILDAFSRAAGFDDGSIHHLDVVKLVFPDAEECIYIRVAPSALNEHSDVTAPAFHHSWSGMERIELADYMPPAGERRSVLPHTRKKVRRHKTVLTHSID